MNIYFNPLDTACKSITGGIYREEELQLNLFFLSEEYAEKEVSKNTFLNLSPTQCRPPSKEACLVLGKDGEARQRFPMQKTAYGWTMSFKIAETGLYFYSFTVEDNTPIFMGKDRRGETGEPFEKEFQLTVSAEDYRTPDWFKGGILYQIFPDRFCKVGTMPDINGRIPRSDWGGIPAYRPNEKGKILNNDFFGGNLQGIRSKLSYLKSLNVSTIYLNPIFEAASNHRYDTSDYLKIDRMLGSESDLRELTEEAKKYGIRIILDGVFNHTGDNSVYFNKYGTYSSLGAYQSKDSPYYSWYTFQEFPDKYSSWWGIDILPEVNEESKDYQDFVFGNDGVLKHWLSCGIGGYRLDVADELPDFFLQKLRQCVKETDSDAIIIGEVWEDASNKIAYSKRREYLQGYELDSVMNYPLKDGIIHFILTGNAETLANVMRMLQDNYPKQTLDCLMNILGTHDTARILTVLGEKNCYTKDEMASPKMLLDEWEKSVAIEKLKMAALLQYSFPGVPCIYYGDENAAEGYIDPFCRKCFDWENLNESLIEYYRQLGNLRSEFFEIFKDGGYAEIFVNDGCILFQRAKDDKRVYVYANNSSEGYFVTFDGRYREYLQDSVFDSVLEIKPYSYGIFSHKDSLNVKSKS